jgi:hypothetical protein
MFGVDTSIMWESPKIQNLFVTGQSKMAHCTKKKKNLNLGGTPQLMKMNHRVYAKTKNEKNCF